VCPPPALYQLAWLQVDAQQKWVIERLALLQVRPARRVCADGTNASQQAFNVLADGQKLLPKERWMALVDRVFSWKRDEAEKIFKTFDVAENDSVRTCCGLTEAPSRVALMHPQT
jgi:hypothetical protein